MATTAHTAHTAHTALKQLKDYIEAPGDGGLMYTLTNLGDGLFRAHVSGTADQLEALDVGAYSWPDEEFFSFLAGVGVEIAGNKGCDIYTCYYREVESS